MAEKVLMKGNEAIAEAAIRAGCRHYFGYPITPQTEVAAYMAKRMPKIGGVFLQAESELAAVNMVLGAAAAGKRAMTSSSAQARAWAGSSPPSRIISRPSRAAATAICARSSWPLRRSRRWPA